MSFNSEDNTFHNVAHTLNRGSNMSAHVLLNLLNELGKKEIKCELVEHFISFATSLIYSIIQKH